MNPKLLDCALRALRCGTLPPDDARVFGAKSAGTVCAVCGESITVGSEQIDLESETTNLKASVHPACHIAWHHALVETGQPVSVLPHGLPW
jgi:hypothetical protein